MNQAEVRTISQSFIHVQKYCKKSKLMLKMNWYIAPIVEMSYMYARNLSCKRRTGFNKMEKNLSVILKSRKISFEKYMYILEIKEYRAFLV